MKKTGLKILSLICLLFVVVAFHGESIYAMENNGGFNIFANTLQGYSGSANVVEIPSGVKIINDYCFENNSTVTKIIVPEGVEVIGKYAFSRCPNLEEVVLPNSLKEIKAYAFDESRKLTKVTMPNTLSSVGYGIFLRCSSLQSIVWPVCSEIPDSAFAECTSLASVTIPEGVTRIGEGAFNRSGITTLVLPQSLKSIGARCFEESAISSINIPGKVTEIPEYAFHMCKKLQSIRVEGALNTIGAWSFFECSALASFPTVNSLTTIKDHAFGHSGIKEMTIPNLQTLETEAFGTSSLEKITIGGPITTIPKHCFQDSDNLHTVVLTDSIKRIEYAAFNTCDNIVNINMPVSLEFVGECVFQGCDKITELKFYDALTTIEQLALGGMKGLKKVSLPGNVTGLSPDFMFRGVTTKVEAPVGSVTYNILKNAGYNVVAPGTATSNGGGSSNGGNSSYQGNASSDAATANPEETTVNDVVEKITTANDGDKIILQSNVLDQKVLETLKGKNIELTLDLGEYSWIIDGKSLTSDAYTGIDMSVTLDSNAIDEAVVKSIAKDAPTKQISLVHNGEFGFVAKLCINLGSEYAGQFGNLYYYNNDGELEFQTAGEIKEDGAVALSFQHASDYVIVIDKDVHDLSEADTEISGTEELPTLGEDSDNKEKTGNPWFVVIVIILLGGAAGGGYWYWKNKDKFSENNEEIE